MSSTTVYTNEPAPELTVPTLSGDTFTLSERNPEAFTIVVFYRGRHCPICIGQLKEIEAAFEDAKAKGMDVIAISMDTEEKARSTVAAALSESEEKKDNDTLTFPIGYGLTEEQARNWGLYISQGRPNTSEPQVFSEPGVYAISPDNTVFFAQVQSAPFTRPNFLSLIGGLQWSKDNNYPARGQLTKK